MSTWCTYRPEFVGVFQSVKSGTLGREECAAKFREEFEGKVRADDWRIVHVATWRPCPFKLELKLPNLHGEFSDEDEANALAASLGPGAVVVPWGSDKEQKLLEYGVGTLRVSP